MAKLRIMATAPDSLPGIRNTSGSNKGSIRSFLTEKMSYAPDSKATGRYRQYQGRTGLHHEENLVISRLEKYRDQLKAKPVHSPTRGRPPQANLPESNRSVKTELEGRKNYAKKLLGK